MDIYATTAVTVPTESDAATRLASALDLFATPPPTDGRLSHVLGQLERLLQAHTIALLQASASGQLTHADGTADEEDHIATTVVATGRATTCDDAQVLDRLDLSSGLWVPVVVDRRPLAVLRVGWSERRDIGPDDRRIAEAAAVWLAGRLARDELHTQLERRRRERHTTLAVATELVADLDVASLAERIVAGVTEVTDFTVAVLTVREGDSCRRVAAAGVDDPRIGLRTEYDRWHQLLQEPFRRHRICFLIPPHASETDWVQTVPVPEADDLTDRRGRWTPEHGLVIELLDETGRRIGFLSVDAPRSGLLPDDQELEQLELFARHAQIGLGNARLHTATRQAAERDGLTGLRNRRTYQRDLVPLLDPSTGASPVALVLFDVDDFKAVNDDHGHGVGDDVLVHVADRLRRSIRQTDTAYRIGGEEFAVLMPATSEAEAATVADRIRTSIAVSRADLPPVTVSIGVAIAPAHAAGADALFHIADRALYAAKAAGKDQVWVGPVPSAASGPDGTAPGSFTDRDGRRRPSASVR